MNALPAEQIVNELAWLLLGAALMGMLARWIHIPYAVALVICGLVIEGSHLVAVPQLEPNLVLFVFLPPLLFDAAFRFDTAQLRTLVRPIALLAVPGTLVTAALIGIFVSAVLHLPLAAGAALRQHRRRDRSGRGRRRLSAPRGGTLDCTRSPTARAWSTTASRSPSTSPFWAPRSARTRACMDAVGVFATEVVGGVAIGLVLGFVCSRVGSLIDDHLIEMTLSTALAYGSFLIADALHTSGPLAVVAAGLVHGSYGRRFGMSESTRRLLDDLWEYLGFAANSLVFLGVGLTVDVRTFGGQIEPALVAIVATLLARAVVVVGYAWLDRADVLSVPEQVVLIWGGLRGALSIALVLALPAETPERNLLTTMTYGVVLFTLVVQGLTLPFLVRRAGLSTKAVS